MEENKQLIVITHLSQLFGLFTLIGGFLVPLIIWLTQKDKVYQLDAHGKMVLNFQLSLFIYGIVSIPLILLFGVGILMLIVFGILGLVLPIVNAIKVSQHETPNYYIGIAIIK